MAIVLFMLSAEANASTGSKWSPSWEGGGSSSRAARDRDLGTKDVSPFSPGSNNLSLALGQVFLIGDLTKYSDSIGSQLHYTYGVSDLFGFDASLGYSEHSDGKFSMTNFLAGMRMNMSWYDKVIPYGIFGLGFYRPSYKDLTILGPNGSPADAGNISAVLFGVHLGPGIDLELSRNLFFGAALTIHNIFGATKTFANGTPLNIGGTFASFFLHLGVTF